MSKYLVIVSHARFNDNGQPVHGTASELAPFLENKKIRYLYIQHSLFKGHGTHIRNFYKKRIHEKLYGFTFLPFPLRILQEFFLTCYFVYKQQSHELLYIGIDPLNASVGIFLKKIGKVHKVVFYTADYADKRYANFLMNKIYHWFDKFCVNHADQVWNVSSRITKLRKEQGVIEKKNFFIPNAPVLKKDPTGRTYEKHTLVIVTHITKAIDFKSIFVAVKNLKKKYKDIKLIIVGNGDYQKELIKKVSSLSLTKQVVFTGSKTHSEVMEILAKSSVGLAIYTNDYPWTKYGDSMKAREYLACGLPVIITDVPSTADDIKSSDAGIVIKRVSDIESAIDELFSNNVYYKKVRRNAIQLALKYDFSKSLAQTALFSN